MGLDQWVSIGSLVQTGVVILGVPLALSQLRQGQRARNLEAVQSSLSQLHEDESYARRARLRELRARGVEVPGWSEDNLLDALITTDLLQRVGFLVTERLIDTRLVLSMYSGLVIEMWSILEPFVTNTRAERSLANYAADFEKLAESSAAYRRRRFPLTATRATARKLRA